MRTVVCRYGDLAALRRATGGEEPELPAPEAVDDGEWVLAVVEVGERRATALAARGTVQPSAAGGESTSLAFEPRDWDVLRRFVATSPSTVPAAPEPSPSTHRSPRRSTTPTSGPKSSRPSRRMKVQKAAVLVVDDDPDLRDVVGAMLEAVGLSVRAVGSAEEALSLVRSERFDLMVLDWTLPGRSGLELCRDVRTLPGVGDIPMLFLTAHSLASDMVEAFASGADDYVVKPFRAPELGARIFALLRRARPPEGG